MKKQDLQKYREMDLKQLRTELHDVRIEFVKTRLQKKARKLENISLVKKLADRVARLKTFIRELEIKEAIEDKKNEAASKKSIASSKASGSSKAKSDKSTTKDKVSKPANTKAKASKVKKEEK